MRPPSEPSNFSRMKVTRLSWFRLRRHKKSAAIAAEMPTTPPTTPPAMAPACEDLLDFTAVGLGSFELVEVELPEVELLCFFINNQISVGKPHITHEFAGAGATKLNAALRTSNAARLPRALKVLMDGPVISLCRTRERKTGSRIRRPEPRCCVIARLGRQRVAQKGVVL